MLAVPNLEVAAGCCSYRYVDIYHLLYPRHSSHFRKVPAMIDGIAEDGKAAAGPEAVDADAAPAAAAELGDIQNYYN